MEHTLLLLVLLVLTVLFLVLKQSRQKFSTYPPGPYPLPVLGNFLQLLEKPHIAAALANLAKLHGPLMSVRLGSKLVVVGSSQEAAMEILKVHDRAISGRFVPKTLQEVSRKGSDRMALLAAPECTENWKVLRTLVKSELFSSKAIESKVALREEKVKELVSFSSSKEGKVVKIGEVVFTTAVNTISTLLFSKDFMNIYDEGVVGGVMEHITAIMEVAGTPNIGDFIPLFSRFDIQGLMKKFLPNMKRLYAAWDVIIGGRQQSKVGDVKEKDFLDVLHANGFNNDQIIWFVSEIFIASIDTTSATIEWTMAELIKNQDVMSVLGEELDKEIGANIVTDSDLPRLPYLHACIKEAMRLHPPVPIIHRRATETCQVMNRDIPQGTNVWVNVWAIGRDAATWDDPLAFKPSRFLESNLDFRGSNYEFVPFGSGKRMCPGMPLAAKMAQLIVASLVHLYDWRLAGNMKPSELDMTGKLGITLQREKPLLLIPNAKNLAHK